MSDYGIPYMGSKAKIARSICMKLPKADHFYDLFGGGFSMTHCMMQDFKHKYKTFHYNEIKTDVVDLVKKSVQGEYNYNVFKPEWISSEDFNNRKDNDAYVRCIWSFGNNQKNYLFSKEIEPFKKSFHMAIVFDEFDDFAYKILGFRKWPAYAKTIKQKRFYVRQKVVFEIGKRGGLEQLERLQQLQQLQQLEQLHLYSESYDEIDIKPNSIAYCDIPYEGTADYGNTFDRKRFLDWASSANFPVYISEYNVSDSRFKLIYEIDKRSLLSHKKENKVMSEKLFWNGK